MITTEKTCKRCGCLLPIEDFYKHPQMADGHLNICKNCKKEDVRAYRKQNIIKYKQYDRKRANNPDRVKQRKTWWQDHPEMVVIHTQKYRRKYPEKYIAHLEVQKAIQTGKLIKQPCEICGENKKVHAHHEDYSKPLEVIWLCPKHHRWIHK